MARRAHGRGRQGSFVMLDALKLEKRVKQLIPSESSE